MLLCETWSSSWNTDETCNVKTIILYFLQEVSTKLQFFHTIFLVVLHQFWTNLFRTTFVNINKIVIFLEFHYYFFGKKVVIISNGGVFLAAAVVAAAELSSHRFFDTLAIGCAVAADRLTSIVELESAIVCDLSVQWKIFKIALFFYLI